MARKFIQVVPVYPLTLTFKEDYFTWPAVMMREQGYECEFVTLSRKVSKGGVESSASSAAHRDFEMVNGFPVRRFSNFLALLWYVFRQDCVIHSHLRPYLPSLLAGLLPKRKVITPFTYELGSSFIIRQLSLFLLRRFDRVVPISPYEGEVYLQHGFRKERVVWVPLAIDYGLFSGARKERAVAKKFGIREDASFTVVTVANFRYFKRVDVLLRAFAEVRKLVKDSQLVVVGDDWLAQEGKPSIAEMVRELGLKGVVCTGYQPAEVVCKILKFADVFANTSSVESQCIAAYEAAASGLPLCLSDIPSFTGVFKGHALYHAYDDHSQLAGNLLRYFRDKGLARKHAFFLREFVKGWDYGPVLKRMRDLYQGVFGRNP